jgi:hypothetical protein
MKKLIAAALLYAMSLMTACSPAYADSHDPALNQRNSTDAQAGLTAR